jgi:hypothetical protein
MITIVLVLSVQHVLQPADAVDVEVVGRLVQQQDVRVAEERLREEHPQLPARRHPAHRAVVLLLGDAEAEEQLRRSRFGGVAAVLRVLRLQLRRFYVVVLRRALVRVDRVALLHRAPHLRVAHQHHVEDALGFIGELVLAEPAEALVRVDRDRARARLELAGEDLHERGFPAAVRADQAVAVAAAELDVDVGKEGLGPVLHGDAGGDDH